MSNIGNIFTSRARTEVLRVLVCQSRGIGLRKTARLADVHPHSAELVLNALVKEKLAESSRCGNRRLFKLNRNHEYVPILEAVFSAATDAEIRAKSRTLQKRAKSVLPFITETKRMLKRAKGPKHVTGKTV